jgi:hypothetical protein
MTVTLIVILAGFLLGCASAALIGWSMLLLRTYRDNRIAIRLYQFSVLISIGGGLLLIQVLEQYLAVKRHSHPYYAAIWAYITGSICATFFARRADIRWKKSIGPDRKTSQLAATA